MNRCLSKSVCEVNQLVDCGQCAWCECVSEWLDG